MTGVKYFSIAKLSLYVIRHTPEMFADNMRHIKIGFHDTHNNKNFYLTASTEVGKESAVAVTEVSRENAHVSNYSLSTV